MWFFFEKQLILMQKSNQKDLTILIMLLSCFLNKSGSVFIAILSYHVA